MNRYKLYNNEQYQQFRIQPQCDWIASQWKIRNHHNSQRTSLKYRSTVFLSQMALDIFKKAVDQQKKMQS